jgi:hypothetical protein
VRDDAEISLELWVHVAVLYPGRLQGSRRVAETPAAVTDYFFQRGWRAADKFRDGSTDGLREIAILEQLVCHKSPDPSADGDGASDGIRSAAELVDDPKDNGQQHADHDARHEREIKRAMRAAMNNVSGQAAQAEGKFAAEVQESADGYEHHAENKQGATQLLGWFHARILTGTDVFM